MSFIPAVNFDIKEDLLTKYDDPVGKLGRRFSELDVEEPRKKMKCEEKKVQNLTAQFSKCIVGESALTELPNSHSKVASIARGVAKLRLKALYKKCKTMIGKTPNASPWIDLIAQMTAKVKELEKKPRDT